MEAVTERLKSTSLLLSLGASFFSGSIERMVSEMVSKMLREKGVAIVSQMIHSEEDKLMSHPVSQLLMGEEQMLARF